MPTASFRNVKFLFETLACNSVICRAVEPKLAQPTRRNGLYALGYAEMHYGTLRNFSFLWIAVRFDTLRRNLGKHVTPT